jgi:hypothetical protein
VGSAAWVLVVLAAVLIVVALVVFVAPLGRSRDGAARGARTGGAPSATGSLARGFSYLHVSSRSPARRGGVHERLARAFARIDAVDPHAAPRRIGETLVQGRRTDASGGGPASTARWSAGAADSTGEVR